MYVGHTLLPEGCQLPSPLVPSSVLVSPFSGATYPGVPQKV
jgi:hypothetical protein